MQHTKLEEDSNEDVLGVQGTSNNDSHDSHDALTDKAPKTEVFGAAFSLANIVVGAGVGGTPYVLKSAGFFSGLLLIPLVAFCSDYSVRLLIALARKKKAHHYEDLVVSQFGQKGYNLVVSAMGIFAYGAMVAYLIGIGDNMSIVVAHWSGLKLDVHPWIKRVTLTTIALLGILPLALLKDMAKLSKTAMISFFSTIFVLLVVVIRAITGPGDAPVPTDPAERELKFIDKGFFPAIGVMAFAFVCHHACFMIFNSLRDNTPARWAKTTHLSLGAASVVMMILSAAAFLTFRSYIKGSFITNYSYTDNLCNVMRLFFSVAQMLTFPMELFVARHSLHAVAFPAERWTDKQHYSITILLWASALAIALNITDLSTVLELTGGVAAISIGFLFPAVLHFKIVKKTDFRFWKLSGEARKKSFKMFWRSYLILLIGALAMFFTILSVGHHIVSGEIVPHDAYDGSSYLDEYGQVVKHGQGVDVTHLNDEIEI